MSAIFFAVPLSVMLGALAMIRRGRADRHCATLVAIRRMPENSMWDHARHHMYLARHRNHRDGH